MAGNEEEDVGIVCDAVVEEDDSEIKEELNKDVGDEEGDDDVKGLT